MLKHSLYLETSQILDPLYFLILKKVTTVISNLKKALNIKGKIKFETFSFSPGLDLSTTVRRSSTVTYKRDTFRVSFSCVPKGTPIGSQHV